MSDPTSGANAPYLYKFTIGFEVDGKLSCRKDFYVVTDESHDMVDIAGAFFNSLVNMTPEDMAAYGSLIPSGSPKMMSAVQLFALKSPSVA